MFFWGGGGNPKRHREKKPNSIKRLTQAKIKPGTLELYALYGAAAGRSAHPWWPFAAAMCKEVNPFSAEASADAPELSSSFKHSIGEKDSIQTHTHRVYPV